MTFKPIPNRARISSLDTCECGAKMFKGRKACSSCIRKNRFTGKDTRVARLLLVIDSMQDLIAQGYRRTPFGIQVCEEFVSPNPLEKK